MMKKLFFSILAFGFFLVHYANAQSVKIFDLKNQYFSETLKKKNKYEEARYDVGNVIVTTDTKFNGYSYENGIFTVDIKNPLNNWNVNIKKKNGTQEGGEITAIRLTSDIGNSYFISYNVTKTEDVIQINDKSFKVDRIQNQKLTSTISKNDINAKFYINGKTFLKINSKNFGNLAKIEVELNDNRFNDELFALDIYKVN